MKQKKENKQKRKLSKRKWICITMVIIAAIFFCVPFDFKYIKKKSKQGGVDFSTFELVERSTTPDDSVCVVTDIDDEGKKYFKSNQYLSEDVFNNCFIPQRISSNKFASFKIDISQRTFDLFTLLREHYDYNYGDPFKLGKREELQKSNFYYMPSNDASKIDYVKTQYYDIDKHSTIEGEDISKELKKGSIRNYVYCTMPYEMCYLQNKKTGNWDIRYGYVYKYKKGILFNTGNGYLNDKRCRFNMNNEKEDIYEISLKDSLESENMFSFPFYKLLKKNGVDYKYICYAPYCSEYSYDDLEMYIRTEGLPNKSAKLYKIYPKLKQYIGKKDKLVSLFIKGAKNPDELVSYFLPEGKKVNYGKKGIEVDDDSKKRFRSYEEYLQIKKEE